MDWCSVLKTNIVDTLPTGSKGDDGLPGLPGQKGDRGRESAAGRKGERGLQGRPGRAGDKGRDGTYTVHVIFLLSRSGELRQYHMRVLTEHLSFLYFTALVIELFKLTS